VILPAQRLLGPDDPPPFTILRPNGSSPIVFTCEHAGRQFPRALGTLGLGDHDLTRHIAYDIGVHEVTTHLSQALDATAVLQHYSRLVVDCNRAPHADDFIATVSETTTIPGNLELSGDDARRRQREIFDPYHSAIGKILDGRAAAGRESVLVSMHSCTDVYLGVWRPWHIGVLYERDDRFARVILDLLAAHGELTIGENEPYKLDHQRDYSVPLHGEARGILHVELEIRQDLIRTDRDQAVWAEKLAVILREGLQMTLQQSGERDSR